MIWQFGKYLVAADMLDFSGHIEKQKMPKLEVCHYADYCVNSVLIRKHPQRFVKFWNVLQKLCFFILVPNSDPH